MSTVLSATQTAPKSNEDSIPTNKAGERTFHNTDAAYVLPNEYVRLVICLEFENKHIYVRRVNSVNRTSNIEHQRLELQSRLLYRLMGNKVFHSPLDRSKIHKALDIGCGTGAVAHEMASMFPDAQVFGADLSPVPEVRQKLPNISYVQGNIMELEDARFKPNSFDLIFSRLLVLGMPNWKAYVERCVALAKPGVS
jgi:2-polyprenyl-3-methyl-5-hydroxy-6-metoxy-1,4-benzoquinol methylase